MRHISLLFGLLLLCSILFISSCKNFRTAATPSEINFRVHASAQHYTAALGKGRGVLFHIVFTEPASINCLHFKMDSLLVHGKNIPVSWTEQDHKPRIEGNYFVAEKEPEPGKIPEPTVVSADPIIYFSEYQPSWLYFHYENQPYTISISQFEPISE